MLKSITRALYIIFAITCFSASFGVSAVIVSSVLLFIASFILIIRNVRLASFLLHEKLAFLLVISLLVTAFFRENYASGILFILTEYRLLYTAPFISIALFISMSKTEILRAPLVGLSFNFLGSFFLTLKIVGWKAISEILGIRNAAGFAYALDGKFVQSWIMTIWAGISGGFLLRMSSITTPPSAIAMLIALLGLFLFHGLLIDARTGVLGIFLVLSIIAICGFRVIRRTLKSRQLFIILAASSVVIFYFISSPRIGLLVIEFLDFFSGAPGSKLTSVGQRLLSWTNIGKLDLTQMIFGVGAGNWLEYMKAWYSEGSISVVHLKWRDFHSEYIWIAVNGGLLSLFFYVALGLAIAVRSLNHLREGFYPTAGLGFSIFVIIIVVGIFNSVFIAVRESHITVLCLIIWSTLVRIYENNKIIK